MKYICNICNIPCILQIKDDTRPVPVACPIIEKPFNKLAHWEKIQGTPRKTNTETIETMELFDAFIKHANDARKT